MMPTTNNQDACLVQFYKQVRRTGSTRAVGRAVDLVTEERYGHPPRQLKSCDVIRFDTTPPEQSEPKARACKLHIEECRRGRRFIEELPIYEITLMRNGSRRRLAADSLPNKATLISGPDANTPGELRFEFSEHLRLTAQKKTEPSQQWLNLGRVMIVMMLLAAAFKVGYATAATDIIMP